MVPARNEATYVGRTLPSPIAQDYPGRVCVILVDDNSEDRTRAIAEAMATRPGRLLEVIGARPRPTGWSGKLWAVSEGLRRGFERMPDAPYVLLTDADVRHDPGNLRRLVAKAEADRLDLVSLMFRLHCQRPWERLLISALRLLLSRALSVRRGQPAATQRSRRERRLHPGAARGASPHRRHRVDLRPPDRRHRARAAHQNLALAAADVENALRAGELELGEMLVRDPFLQRVRPGRISARPTRSSRLSDPAACGPRRIKVAAPPTVKPGAPRRATGFRAAPGCAMMPAICI